MLGSLDAKVQKFLMALQNVSSLEWVLSKELAPPPGLKFQKVPKRRDN